MIRSRFIDIKTKRIKTHHKHSFMSMNKFAAVYPKTPTPHKVHVYLTDMIKIKNKRTNSEKRNDSNININIGPRR